MAAIAAVMVDGQENEIWLDAEQVQALRSALVYKGTDPYDSSADDLFDHLKPLFDRMEEALA